MDEVLLSLFCMFAMLHFYPIRLSFYILFTEELSVINTAHGILLFNSIFPIFIGDFLVISSVISNGTFDVSFIVEILDFIGIMTFHALFIHVFEYRDTLIYKGLAHRFYDYVYRLLLFKVLSVPIGCLIGILLASASNYSTTAFLVIYQSLIALGTAMMYLLLKYKFESLDIIPSPLKNTFKAEVVVSVGALRSETNNNLRQSNQSSKKSAKEKYEEAKLDIYENLKKHIIGTTIAVIVAIILLSIFRSNTSFDKYYLSIYYRLILLIPLTLCSEPIMKSCADKRNKVIRIRNLSNNVQPEDEIFGSEKK